MNDELNIILKRGRFWRITINDQLKDSRYVERHDINYDVFDYLTLLRGKPLDEPIPSHVRLYLNEGEGRVPDFVANVLGWPIMSDRLVRHLWPMIKDDIQCMAAPLYESSGRRVEGWHVINVTRVIDCVDFSCSTVRYYQGRPSGFDAGGVCIDPARTQGAHMFKCMVSPGKADFEVICSYELIQSLRGKRFTGIAVIRCRSLMDSE